MLGAHHRCRLISVGGLPWVDSVEKQGFVYELAGYQMPFLIAAGVAVLDGVLRILLVSDDKPTWKAQKRKEERQKRRAGEKATAAAPAATLNPGDCEAMADDDIESGDSAGSPRPQPAEADPPTTSPGVKTPLLAGKKESSTTHGSGGSGRGDDQPEAAALTAAEAVVPQPLSFWDLVQNKSILITSVVVLLASNALTVLEPTLPTHLEKVFDSTPMLTGLVFMCESLVDIVASPLVGWYSDRVGNKPLMIAGMLLAGLVMVLHLLLVFIFFLGSVALTTHHRKPIVALPTEWWQQYLAVSAMAVCNALMLTPTLPELAAQVDAMGGGAYGQVYAIYNFFYSRTLYYLSSSLFSRRPSAYRLV